MSTRKPQAGGRLFLRTLEVQSAKGTRRMQVPSSMEQGLAGSESA